ncbi:YlqD family protein [bacterium]|nr:YlqD family protein [bacterium]
MGIVIKRPVRVKVIVTEQFKEHRLAEMRAAQLRLEEVSKRLGAQLESASVPESIMERLRAEQRKSDEAKAALIREMSKVSSLEIGSEYERGVLEGDVEIEVGDDFSKVSSCEIVIKDEKVVEIRSGHAG